jgi:hypothetical protein
MKRILQLKALMVIAIMLCALNGMAATHTVKLYSGTAPSVGGIASGTEHFIGSGAWQNNQTASKFELYLPLTALGTFTINDIASLQFSTKKVLPVPATANLDFYWSIYTQGAIDASWYGHRLTSEPMYYNGYNAPYSTWSTYQTGAGTNQMTFFDSNHSPKGYSNAPTLANLQTGPIDWSYTSPFWAPGTAFDYRPEEIKYISISTGSGDGNSSMLSFLDGIQITLKNGEILIIDLENNPTPTTTIMDAVVSTSGCGYIDVPVTVKDFNDVGAISLVLNYVKEEISYNGITLNEGLTGALVNTAKPGQVRLTYVGNPVTLPTDAVLFTLRFTLPATPVTTTNLTWSTDPNDREYTGPNGQPVYVSTFIDKTLTIPARPVKNLNTSLQYCTIQAAIDDPLTLTGHVIECSPGTYTEMVTINKSIHLQGKAGEMLNTFIQAPSTLPAAADQLSNIILVTGNGISAEISGLTIQGPGPTACGSMGRGIFVRDGAMANIHHNQILNIRDNVFSGCQNGIAIQVGRNAWTTTGTATISNNLISGYQKGGIVVDNSGSSAVITDNTITGAGTTTVIGQNGIQISRGATASLHGNAITGNSFQVAGNIYNYCGTGLLLYQSGAVAMTGGNTLSGNDQNYSASGVTGALTMGAEIFGASTAPVTFGYHITNSSNQNIDAGSCLFETVSPSGASLTELFTIEDRIWHNVDDGLATTGFVQVKAMNDYVTRTETDAHVQYGIDAAANGWTVNVGPGTFIEGNPQMMINKSINLVGWDKATTIVKPAVNTGNSGDARGWVYLPAGNTVNISNLTFDGEGKLVNIGILSKSAGVINNCIVRNIGYNASGPDYAGRGIAFYDCDMTVSNSSLSNIGRIGIYMYGSATDGIITGNTFIGKGTGNFLDYGVEVEGGASATITANTISDCKGIASDGSTSAGILATTYFAPGTKATVQNNFFLNNDVDIADGYDAADGTTIVAHGNSFVGSSVAISNAGTVTADATCNWYGSAASAVVAGKISGPVTYMSWLVSGADNSTDIGFQPVPGSCSGTQVIVKLNTKTDVACLGGSEGAVNINVSGGTVPYTYLWTPGNKTTEDLTGLTAGDYTVVVTDGNGSTATLTVTVATLPDTTPPVFTTPANAITVNNDAGQCGAVVNFMAPISISIPASANNGGTSACKSFWQSFKLASTGVLQGITVNNKTIGTNWAYTVYAGEGIGGCVLFSGTLVNVPVGSVTLPIDNGTLIIANQPYTYAITGPADAASCSISVDTWGTWTGGGTVYADGKYWDDSQCPTRVNTDQPTHAICINTTFNLLKVPAGMVVSDNCTVKRLISSLPSDYLFPIGPTEVTFNAYDCPGNEASSKFTVTVNDIEFPKIQCPVDVTAYTNEGCTSKGVVLGTPVASDNCGVPSVGNNAPTAFPLGETLVTWTATDLTGHVATCTQKVTVSDNVPPTITCPQAVNVTTNAGCTATGVDLGTPVTGDNCGVKSVANDAPAAFPVGPTTVTWTVTDNSNNTATCTQVVTVSRLTISGSFNYLHGQLSPMSTTPVTLNLIQDGHVVATTTTTNGLYSFNDICSGIYEVALSTTRTDGGGVNATDAAQVNFWSVSPYSIPKVRFNAGDVNNDNLVLPVDAQKIQQYFLTAGAEGITRSPWSLWKAGDMINANPGGGANPSIPVGNANLTQNFYGLFTGDYNGSFAGLKSAVPTLFLNYGENSLVSNKASFELPVIAETDLRVGAISLILEIPTAQVSVEGVYLRNDRNVPVQYSVLGQELRISWYSNEPVSVKTGESLVTLDLKPLGTTSEEDVMINLASSPLNELADADYDVIPDASLRIGLVKTTSLPIESNTAGEQLRLANFPNPFSGYTNFSYSLPVNGKVILEIRDILGRVVNEVVNQSQPAGNHSFTLDAKTLTSGLYYATIRLIENDQTVLTQTIKIVSTK